MCFYFRLLTREGEFCGMVIDLSNVQNWRHKDRLIDGIREILHFQTEAVPRAVYAVILAFASNLDIVGGIKVHTGSGSAGRQGNPTFVTGCPRSLSECAGRSFDCIIVVIAPPLKQLIEGLVDVGPYGMRSNKIHGGICHRF